MDKINGINLNNLNSQGKGNEINTENKEITEKDLFEVEDSEQEDSIKTALYKLGEGEICGHIEMPYILTDPNGEISEPIEMPYVLTDPNGDISSLYKKFQDDDSESFNSEEAHVYVEGEAAIEKEIEARYRQQMILEDIRGGKSRAEIEAEVRAEYEEEHPEYVAVKAEGQQVEKEYNKAKNSAMSDWIKDNPMPEAPNPITGGISDSIKYAKELKEWQEKYDAEASKFEEEYAKNNPDYANLKAEQEVQEEKNKFFL